MDGNEQTGVAGEALAAPIVVEVTDAAGHPVEGVTVAFALVSAGEGAAISPATALTGAEGRAEAQVQLGDKVGVQTGEVRLVSDGAPTDTATFSAAAMAAGEPPSPVAVPICRPRPTSRSPARSFVASSSTGAAMPTARW